MVVEFCGVPGGGKSTHIREYNERYPGEVSLVTIDMYRRLPELSYATGFALSHPISFSWLCLFVARNHMRGLFWYSFHLMLRACAKHQKASRQPEETLAIIDEGLVHVLCVLPEQVLTDREMEGWIGRIPLADAFVFARTGDFHRFHAAHAMLHPRVRKGSAALASWEEAVRRNAATVFTILRVKSVSLWTMPERGTSPMNDELREYLRSL
ncbi:MAG: hypothetical protein V4681_03855 [Patescibacteria group bacterium]